MNRFIYSLLLYLLLPLIPLRLLWRSLRTLEYRRRWQERFAFYQGESPEVKIWLHTVSVGEFVAVIPLIQALIEDRQGFRRLLGGRFSTAISPMIF